MLWRVPLATALLSFEALPGTADVVPHSLKQVFYSQLCERECIRICDPGEDAARAIAT